MRPGEASADRDADSALHLLLEADRGARNELRPGLVEQQHGSGVGVEQLTRPAEELGEQLVELEVAERGVGHRLEALQAHPGLALGREEPRVLDGDRRRVRDDLEQVDVLGGERRAARACRRAARPGPGPRRRAALRGGS